MKRDVPPPPLAMPRLQLRCLLVGLSLYNFIFVGSASAQESPAADDEQTLPMETPAAPERLAVYIEISQSELTEDEIEQALAEEFKMPIVRTSRPMGLMLRIEKNHLSASFIGEGNSVVEREMLLPDEKSHQVTTISLLSGSIARDETGALIAKLRAPLPAMAEESDVEEIEEEVPAGEARSEAPPSPEAAPQEAGTKAPESPSNPEPKGEKLPEVFASASFVSPISYPSQLSKKTTRLHGGAITSDIGSLRGVALTFISHRNRGADVDGSGRGVQLAVGYLQNEGSFSGVNGAALVANNQGPLQGVLLGGLFSLQGNDLLGAQLSGLVSAATGRSRGAQLGGLSSFHLGSVDGVQAGGLLTFVLSDLTGVQAAGLSNITAGKVDGTQLSSLSNYAQEGMTGFQMSSLNVAWRRLDGVQVGLLNLAGDFKGTQFGLLNIGGRGKGTQVGLINIAKDLEGAAVAPINIIPGTRNQLLSYVSYFPSDRVEGTPQGPMVHLGLKVIPGTVYTQIGFGVGFESKECVPQQDGSRACFGDQVAYAPSFAIGARSTLNKLFHLDMDAQYQYVRGTNSSRSSLHQILGRAAFGLQITPGFGIFAGGGPRLDFHEGPRVSSAPDINLGWHAFSGLSFF